MADVRMTAAEARATARVDRALLDATTPADIDRHQVEDGEPAGTVHDDWMPSPRAVRDRLNLAQPAMAELLGVPLGTWRNWEQGRVMLDPAVRTLLRLVWREPEAALRALRIQAA